MKFDQLQAIATATATGNSEAILNAIDAAMAGESGKGWQTQFAKLRQTIVDGRARFSIMAADGNSKLPFVAFSSLPGVGFCPGAGECLSYCYSFRAWRYPAAFARQVQNSYLLQSIEGKRQILEALDAHKPAVGSIDFRLYVDGDFGSAADVAFWMAALGRREWLKAYGYSKSWAELLQFDSEGGAWPTNYKLNLSGGSRHGDATEARVAALPITRGRFLAVSVGRKVKASDHSDRAHQRELRAAHGGKAFTCPGKCGECTKGAHACGSSKFDGVDIIIAVH